MNARIKKLNFLSLKQKSESAIKVLNSPSTEQVAADANNEDQNNSADEGLDNESKATSKKRKWVPKSQYKRMQNKKKKEKINVIINYSGINISDGAISALNRGLNFSVLP